MNFQQVPTISKFPSNKSHLSFSIFLKYFDVMPSLRQFEINLRKIFFGVFPLFSSVYITYGEQNKLLKKFFCFCFSERICSLQKVKNLRDNKLKQKENVGRMRTYDPRSLIKGGLISKSFLICSHPLFLNLLLQVELCSYF